MRALVTGASGFVGRYLVAELRRRGAEVLDCGGPNDRSAHPCAIDLGDARSLQLPIESFQPTVIFHLAAQTFVPAAMQTPMETYDANVMGTARLAEAVRRYARGERPRIFFTSSAIVYGNRDARDYPLEETLAPLPGDPYGASKAAAEEILLGEARSFGLDVVVARAFNHIGPGQSESFAVASFAAQLARIAGGAPPRLLVGDLGAARDFLDVRDVVRAYVALAQSSEAGGIYNVCSGRAVTIRDVLRELILIARVPVEVREDPARLRATETPLSVGNPQKLQARTGWRAEIPLSRSLSDIYDAARRAIDGR
jgi:GDP-4-dehydro-6-deoxy-D-mannose reductase